MKRLDFRTFKVLFSTNFLQEPEEGKKAAFPSFLSGPYSTPPLFFLNYCDLSIASECQQCNFQSIKDSAEHESFVFFPFHSLLRGNLFLCSNYTESYQAMKLPSDSFSTLLFQSHSFPLISLCPHQRYITPGTCFT